MRLACRYLCKQFNFNYKRVETKKNYFTRLLQCIVDSGVAEVSAGV